MGALLEASRVPQSRCGSSLWRASARIERALTELGAGLREVVGTRTFLTDIEGFDEFARADREAFATVGLAASCVDGKRLVSPEPLVEIEADAEIESGRFAGG